MAADAQASLATEGTIRSLSPGDEPQVLALVMNMLLTYGFRWDPEGLDADVLAPGSYLAGGGTFLVFERDGHIMGTIAARRLDEERLELCRMYLHPALWGEGWGSRLFDALREWARSGGYLRFELEADPRFDRSIGFYERKGFRRLPDEPGQTTGPLRYAMDLRP